MAKQQDVVKFDMRDKRTAGNNWYLGCGELPRFGRDKGTIFYYSSLGVIHSESQKDEFLTPLMDISGVFDKKPTEKKVVDYFNAREEYYMNGLVQEAKRVFPTLKDEQIEKYVAVRQDPTLLTKNAVFEEIAFFISVPGEEKKPLDLYAVEDSVKALERWAIDFNNMAQGALDPTTIDWKFRSETARRVKNRFRLVLDELYELRQKAAKS